jgi:MFS superfamily sulfate permease-like transporter
MAAIGRVRQGEFAVAAVTAAVVVVVGVEQGIILAMVLSIVEHIYHSYRPYDTLLAMTPDGTFGPAPLDDRAEALPGLVIYRFGSGLYYANGTRFTEEIMELVEAADPPLRWLTVSGSAMGDVDYSGADTIRQVKQELARTGVTFAICDLNPKVRGQLDAYGLTELIGTDRIFATATDVMSAYRASADAGPVEAQPAADSAPAEG